METDYDLLLSEAKDRKLKKRLKSYWEKEDVHNSRESFQQMIKNDKYNMSPTARQIANYFDKFFKRTLKPIPIHDVMERIDELLDGAPDE